MSNSTQRAMKCEDFGKNPITRGVPNKVITLPDGTQDVTWKGDGCYEYIESLQQENERLREGIKAEIARMELVAVYVQEPNEQQAKTYNALEALLQESDQ